MHRKLLLDLLNKYNPVTDIKHQVAAKQQIIKFVNENSNCFERELTTGHITSSAWLLDKSLSKVLLMHHAKFDFWCQLGGHCDGDADVLAVAIKEAQEESGANNIVPVSQEIFDLDVHHIPEMKSVPEHYHYDVRFLLKIASDELALGNNESKAIQWFAKHEQLPTNLESIMRMFRKWQRIESEV